MAKLCEAAEVDHADNDGETPLYVAVENGQYEVAQLFLLSLARPLLCRPASLSVSPPLVCLFSHMHTLIYGSILCVFVFMEPFSAFLLVKDAKSNERMLNE